MVKIKIDSNNKKNQIFGEYSIRLHVFEILGQKLWKAKEWPPFLFYLFVKSLCGDVQWLKNENFQWVTDFLPWFWGRFFVTLEIFICENFWAYPSNPGNNKNVGLAPLGNLCWLASNPSWRDFFFFLVFVCCERPVIVVVYKHLFLFGLFVVLFTFLILLNWCNTELLDKQ